MAERRGRWCLALATALAASWLGLVPTAAAPRANLLANQKYFHGLSHVRYSTDGQHLLFEAGLAHMAWHLGDGRTAFYLRRDPRVYPERGEYPETAVYTVAISPDGRWYATSHLYDLTVHALGTGQIAFKDGKLGHYYAHFDRIQFSPDGRWMLIEIAKGEPGYVHAVYDTTTWQRRVDLPYVRAASLAFAFTPDGRWLAKLTQTYEPTGKIELYDTATWALVRTITVPSPAWSYALAISPDGRYLATMTNRLLLWDLRTGALAGQNDRTGVVGSPGVSVDAHLRFSPDGKRLVMTSKQEPDIITPSTARELIVADGATGKTQSALKIPPVVHSLAFTPDGQRLLVSANDTSVATFAVYDLAAGKHIGGFRSFLPPGASQPNGSKYAPTFIDETAITASGDVAVHPAGRYAAISQGTRLLMWDLSTNQEAMRLYPLAGGEWVVSTPDNRYDISTGARPFTVWKVGDLQEYDHDEFKNKLTPGLWRQRWNEASSAR